MEASYILNDIHTVMIVHTHINISVGALATSTKGIVTGERGAQLFAGQTDRG